MDDIVARIRSKLAAACTEPVPRPRGFVRAPGGQRLGTPLSEERVVAYETRHGVRLPHSYRTFLREIGNGGIGPDYGLLPPTRWSAHDIPTASQQLGRAFALEPTDSVAADWTRLRVSTVEALASYIAALGGKLELVADIGGHLLKMPANPAA